MQYFLLFLLISVTIHWSVAPPVNQKKDKDHDKNDEVEDVEEVVYYYLQ